MVCWKFNQTAFETLFSLQRVPNQRINDVITIVIVIRNSAQGHFITIAIEQAITNIDKIAYKIVIRLWENPVTAIR
jgi:hypothetical protein